ncbi:MAG: tripartite tricarboxylate transporter substrate binding protein [Betaproteobacteria bacterium]
MDRRSTLTALGALTALAAGLPAAAQARYPSRPVRIVVPWTPGGAADQTARMLATGMAATLGQPVVVENKAGAGGRIGTEEVARAAADGHTLLLGGPSTNSIPFGIGAPLPYHPVEDFEPVAYVSRLPLVLVTNAAQAIGSLATLVERARARPEMLTYGSAGPGSGTHLATAAVLAGLGLKLTHVPYKGQGPALQDLIGDRITLLMDQMAAKAHVESGRLRALATTGDRRWFVMPDTPTLSELGQRDLVIYSWQAILVPKGTPRDVVQTLNTQINAVLNSAPAAQFFFANGMEAKGGTAEALREFMTQDGQRWQAVVRQNNLKVTD